MTWRQNEGLFVEFSIIENNERIPGRRERGGGRAGNFTITAGVEYLFLTASLLETAKGEDRTSERPRQNFGG